MDKKFNNPLEADAHNWDTRELDDKKLREQITQIISEFKFGDWLEEVMEHERAAAHEVTNQILALIKQAGYVKRVDVLREILTIEQTNPLILMEWLKSQISILGKE